MFEIKSIRTFAMSAKNLDKSVEFYTKIVGGKVVKTVEPTEEQLKAGQVKEVDVRLGNFEVHIFDASKGPRAADPHHTLNIPWQEKDQALKMLQDVRRHGGKNPAAPRHRQLLDQRLRPRRQPLGTVVRQRKLIPLVPAVPNVPGVPSG